MSNHILLIRHGETALNVARVLQPFDTPLSARGVEQARALARRLAALPVAGVVSSDLPRALQTAQIVAAACGASVETSESLRERSYGDWRGLAYDALPMNPLTMREAPPGGESAADFAARVTRSFDLVVQRATALDGDLVVVTHGLVIRAMLSGHVRLPAGTPVPGHLGNTGLSIVDARAPHAVTLLDSTSHLGTALGDDPKALSGG